MKRETTIIKRLLCLILSLVMAASLLAGCGSKEEIPAATAAPTTAPTEPPEVLYTADAEVGTVAVADILSIDPVYEITGANACYVCKCTTVSQGTIYVSVPAIVYYNIFGILAKGMDLTSCPVTLPQPLHITGTVTDANTLYEGLTEEILNLPEEPVLPEAPEAPAEEPVVEEPVVEEPAAIPEEIPLQIPDAVSAEVSEDMPLVVPADVVDDAAADIPVEDAVDVPAEQVMDDIPVDLPAETEAPVVETTEATEPAPTATVLHVTTFALTVSEEVSEFAPNSPCLAPVTAKIVKIYPAFPITTAVEGMLELVCEAQTMDGRIIWLYMPGQMFLDAFNGGDVLQGGAEVFEAAYCVEVRGIVRASEDLNPGLSLYASTMILVENYTILEAPVETIPETEAVTEPVPETLPMPDTEVIPEPDAEVVPEPDTEVIPEPEVLPEPEAGGAVG